MFQIVYLFYIKIFWGSFLLFLFPTGCVHSQFKSTKVIFIKVGGGHTDISKQETWYSYHCHIHFVLSKLKIICISILLAPNYEVRIFQAYSFLASVDNWVDVLDEVVVWAEDVGGGGEGGGAGAVHHGHLAMLRVLVSAANWLIGEVVQSQRRPLLGPSPGWKRLLALSHLRHY